MHFAPARLRERKGQSLLLFFSAQLADQSGRGKRVAALQEGLEVLYGLTEKAKQLSEERELRRLIDEELAKR